jgi:hypothetical protein
MDSSLPQFLTVSSMFLTLCSVALAQVQDKPRGDISFGYSYSRMDLGSAIHTNFQGYELSQDHNLKSWFTIAFLEAGYFGSTQVPLCSTSNNSSCFLTGASDSAFLDTFMAGVQTQTTRGRFTPFARALYGVAFLQACPRPVCESRAAWTQDYGGGIQVRVTEKRFGWRVEGDFLQTHLFGRAQNDFRLSTGPVIWFYKRH